MVTSGRPSSFRAEDGAHHLGDLHRLVRESPVRSCELYRRTLPVVLVATGHWPGDDQQRSGAIAERAHGGSRQTAAHGRDLGVSKDVAMMAGQASR